MPKRNGGQNGQFASSLRRRQRQKHLNGDEKVVAKMLKAGKAVVHKDGRIGMRRKFKPIEQRGSWMSALPR